jgi:nitrate reductase gamma subunit
MSFEQIGITLFVLVVLLIVAGGTAFWIWMIVDCVTQEPPERSDKLAWLLIILLTHVVGALIYYFVRRPQRKASFGH